MSFNGSASSIAIVLRDAGLSYGDYLEQVTYLGRG